MIKTDATSSLDACRIALAARQALTRLSTLLIVLDQQDAASMVLDHIEWIEANESRWTEVAVSHFGC